jgi:hypothetical protein
VTVGVAVGDGVGLGVGDGVGDAVGDGVGVGLAVGEAVGVAEAVALGDGFGVADPDVGVSSRTGGAVPSRDEKSIPPVPEVAILSASLRVSIVPLPNASARSTVRGPDATVAVVCATGVPVVGRFNHVKPASDQVLPIR